MYAAEHLGLPYLSPYLDSIGTNFRHGANFAIGGSTIRPQNESMSLNGVSPFSLDVQIVQYDNFKVRTSYFYKQGYPENRLNTSFLFRFYSLRLWKLCLLSFVYGFQPRGIPTEVLSPDLRTSPRLSMYLILAKMTLLLV